MSSVPAALRRVADRCAADSTLAHTCALLAAVGGVEVAAHDRHGHGLDAPAPTIASVTKSVLSTVVGHAVGDGLVTLDATLGDLLGDRVPPSRRPATVHHLLTMTSGAAGGLLEIDEVMTLDHGWVDRLLAAPQIDPPGAVFRYDNGAPHVLAAAVQAAVGGDLLGYARQVLAPAGAAGVIWPRDPEGVPFGFGDARLSPRALLAFGEAWRTGVAVPPAYRARAWRAWTPGGPPENRGYGYGWWVGVSTRLAAGWAGQAVLVVPDRELTVVATGCPDRWREGFSRAVLPHIDEVVAAAR
jgi:CubicO group peptidase (beta-lactamase class C family)